MSVSGPLDPLAESAPSIASCLQRLAHEPDNPDVINALGAILEAAGDDEKALACFDRALQLAPDAREAHWGRAKVLLRAGRLREGFAEFEWRAHARSGQGVLADVPRWDGCALAGTLLVVADGSVADTLQFVRYLAGVKPHVRKLVLLCQAGLGRLLAGCSEIDQVVESGPGVVANEASHAYIPLMSLPHVFGTSLESIPQADAYLVPPYQRVDAWATRFAGHARQLKIGLVWAAYDEGRRDPVRSLPLRHLEALTGEPHLRLYSLQKGRALAELVASPLSSRIENLAPALSDFADTAAAIANLDLVVSVDAPVAHLAGALGVKVWTVLPFSADWRWLTGREDSPWYPSMRLMRQAAPGDWGSAAHRVTAALCRSGG
ncbi:MAG: tetratricopeptide repeat protein [Betaproteobacteria bacterium]|nr:tetratricopeptide repeat protein [Betaproteobacteria bacterium]